MSSYRLILLREAVGRGDTKAAELSTRDCPELLHYRSKTGEGLMDLAVKSGSVAMVRWLAEKGVQVDDPAGNGFWPLFEAYRKHNSHELVEALLDAGGNAEAAYEGQTLLLHISLHGHPVPMSNDYRVAEMLLQHGADPNRLDATGFSSLHNAALRGLLHMSVLLMSYGGNPLLKRKTSNSNAFDLARSGKNPGMLDEMQGWFHAHQANKAMMEGCELDSNPFDQSKLRLLA